MRTAFAAWSLLALLILLLAPVSAFAGSVTLAWDPVSSTALAGYRLHYGAAAGSYTTSVDVGNVTSQAISNLTDGATYHFAVTAYDALGASSGYSNDVAATVPSSAPVANFSASTQSGPAPLALNFINSSTGTISSYAWTFGDGSSSAAQNPAKTYTSAGTYTVSLTVSGPGGTNTKTNANYITVTAASDTTAPTPPTNLAATANGTSGINLTWTASTDNVGVTGYRVERCQGASCTSFAERAAPTATSFADTGLTAGTSYTYRVRAADAVGNLSAYSNIATATTAVSAPVAAFSGSPTTGTAPMTVNFTSTSTGTNLTYAWSFGDGTTSTAQNPSKVYSNAGTYTVSLTVTGSGGSNTQTRTNYITVTDTSAPTAPGSLGAAANGTGGINLSWSASTDNVGVTGYRVERCQGAGCASFAQIATSTGTSYADTGLSAGTSYSYRVRAADAAGNLGAYSNVATATTAISAPVADFSASATTGTAPLTVNFTSISTGSITSYAWTFGDGTTSSEQNPSKTYSSAGTYTVSLTVAGSSGSNTQTKTNYITVTSAPSAGSGGALAGSVTTRTSDADLSAAGTSDWVNWPGNVRKAAGGSKISNYSVVGAATVYSYSNDRRMLAWNDGSPTVTGSSNSGVAASGVGKGFMITAPADTNSRTLVIYAGAAGASGTLKAHLSDGSAVDFVHTTTATKWGQYDVAYTLTYRAASAGQTLTVTWTQATGGVSSGGRRGSSSSGSVTLQGAALR